MAFLSGIDLEKTLKKSLGKQFNPKRIEQAAYELSLGGEAYLTDSQNKKPEILNGDNKTVGINPGQFALLLAEEKILIPKDKLGLISIKASEKLKGLVNVSGFHVDPGFEGQLLFSVYNAGPSTITLKKGSPYFLLWFSELSKALGDDDVYNGNENHHQKQDGIPPKYMDALKNGVLASPSALTKRIDENHSKIETNKIIVRNFWINLRWIAGIAFGLLFSLNLGYWVNKQKTNNEFKEEVRENLIPVEIDNYIQTINLDSIVNFKLDNKIKALEIKSTDSTGSNINLK